MVLNMKRITLILLGTSCLSSLTQGSSARDMKTQRRHERRKRSNAAKVKAFSPMDGRSTATCSPTSPDTLGVPEPVCMARRMSMGSVVSSTLSFQSRAEGQVRRTSTTREDDEKSVEVLVGKPKFTELWSSIGNLGPTQKDIDLDLNRSILSVLYKFKDTYNDTKNWYKTYFDGKNGVITRMETDIKELKESWKGKKKDRIKIQQICKTYGFPYEKKSSLLKLLEDSKKSAVAHWKNHNQKIKDFLHTFEHFQMYQDDADYRTKAAKFFTVSKTVLKIAYLATVAGLGGGGAIAVQARAGNIKDVLATACNFTKDIDLNIQNALAIKDLISDWPSLGATSLHKAMQNTDKEEEFMNYRVKMDNPGLTKGNSEPEASLKEWIQTYLDTGAQLQFRELSECERAKMVENRFRIQNLFSERTLPPQGVKFKQGDIVDKKKDGIHRTYVERFVFVAESRGPCGHSRKNANKQAIENFRTELKKLDDHTYVGFNPNTKNGELVGCMEFKRPRQLWHKGVQGFHYANKVVGTYLEILCKTHDFTVYHLGKGNGDVRVSAEEESEWIPTRDWQTLPIIKQCLERELSVPRNTSQLNDLEMFKRAAVAVDQINEKPEDKYMDFPKYDTIAKVIQDFRGIKAGEKVTVLEVGTNGHVKIDKHSVPINPRDWKDNFEHLGITPMVFDAPQVNRVQFGYPCEFKTPVFMQPFKFYTKYGEALKQVDPKVKLNHRMQLIRTITDGNILNKKSVELKRARALEIVTKKVKNLESWTKRQYPRYKEEM